MVLISEISKENMVHLHNGTLFGGQKKKNDIMKFAGKWMELEKKSS